MHTNNGTLHFKTLCNANGDCRGGQKSTKYGCDIDIQLDTGRERKEEGRKTRVWTLMLIIRISFDTFIGPDVHEADISHFAEGDTGKLNV
ncbi:hypothetical protein ACLKA6_004708 [Drosophila palustris]